MESVLYAGSIGINNKVVPHRLPFDRETGVAALEQAIDVLIDRTGEIITTRGSVLVEPGVFHSTFKTNGGFYVVQDRDTDSALFRAIKDSQGDISLAGIRSGMVKGAKVSYGFLDGKTYYANGYDHGCLQFDESKLWTSSKWTGPETTAEMIATPVGKHIGVVAGRLVLSVGNEIFYTEYGLPGIVDFNRNRRRFESEIIMVCAVPRGVYVSDTEAVYFLAGTNPSKWSSEPVLNYPAIEYGVNNELVDPSNFGLDLYKLSCLFATVKGPVIGLPDGTPINLIKNQVSMPTGCGSLSGSIMVVDETLIIQSSGE